MLDTVDFDRQKGYKGVRMRNAGISGVNNADG